MNIFYENTHKYEKKMPLSYGIFSDIIDTPWKRA